jgi:hypothetical protein
MRRAAVAAIAVATALAAADGAAAAPMKVRNALELSRADGSPIAFDPEVRVWCGPFEPDVPVRAIHVMVGGPPKEGRPRWEIVAVVKDVRRRPNVRLPHSFVFDKPTGAQLFAYDGDNEASSAEEESAGTIRFGRVRCGRRMRISFRLEGRLGSEFSDRGPISVSGSFGASRS